MCKRGNICQTVGNQQEITTVITTCLPKRAWYSLIFWKSCLSLELPKAWCFVADYVSSLRRKTTIFLREAASFGVPNGLGWLYTGPQGHKPGTRRSADLSEIWSRKLCDRILGSIFEFCPLKFSAPPFSIRRIKRKSCGKRCRFVWFPNSRVVDRIWISFMVISCNVIRLISIIDSEIWQKNKSPQITRMNTDERTSVYTANVLCQDNWRQLDQLDRQPSRTSIFLSHS